MRNLKSKIKKIENKVQPEKEVVIFCVGGDQREEDFRRQKGDYLMNSGDPNANFIMIIDYF
jgi:hypothetical protein